MRRAARIDGNQQAVVKALRAYGCAVQTLHTVGKGCPDLLVSANGKNWLFEVKDPTQPTYKQILTAAELAWHTEWRKHGGQVTVIRTYLDALAVISSAQRPNYAVTR